MTLNQCRHSPGKNTSRTRIGEHMIIKIFFTVTNKNMRYFQRTGGGGVSTVVTCTGTFVLSCSLLKIVTPFLCCFEHFSESKKKLRKDIEFFKKKERELLN